MKARYIALAAGAGVLGAVCSTSPGAWAADPIAQPRIQTKEVIGKVSSPIVVGDAVSTRRQRQLGLVTVNNNGGTCSGTLINQYWVLTADHCITTDGNVGGPARPFANVRIVANWTAKTARPTRYVRYDGRGLDVALIFLGAGDLGRVDRKLIYHNEVDTSMTLTKFGQGLCSYATGTWPTATPAQGNCGYRTAVFTPSSASATSIALPTNANGQVGNGGDSGGPDYVTDGDGNVLSIASVQSTCSRTGTIAGSPGGWMWTTGISACQSAALLNIRDDIHRVMAEAPPFIVAAPPSKYGDLVVAKPEGVVTKSPSAYKDVMVSKPSSGVSGMVAQYGTASSGTGCKTGYVPRQARASDLVCVTPEVQARTAQENTEAANRVDPAGAYGPNTCISGYVWREAFEGDLVCVAPDIRAQVREDNRLAASRSN
jgi:hypothetical protein